MANGSIEFLITLAIISVVGFFTGFKNLKRARLIEDVPTAKIRSAHQGYLEIIGTAKTMSGEAIIAPLSSTHCCWYDFKVERRNNKSWTTVQSGSSDGLFILQDSTGECLIDPENAEVDTIHSKVWSGSGSMLGEPGVHHHNESLGFTADLSIAVFSSAFDIFSFSLSGYRYSERVILDGDPLYAIGQFKSVDDSDLIQSHKALTSEILHEWKKQPATLKQRFDHNRNEIIDVDEWEDARQAASRDATEEIKQQMTHSHVHLLSKPSNKHFILSTFKQCALVKKHRRNAFIGFLAFFAAGSLSVIILAS